MPALDNERLAIARVWSDALLELAAERGVEETLGGELEDLVRVLDAQPDFERYLASPVAQDREKKDLIERVTRGRASDLLVDALQVLRRKGRLDILRELSAVYHQAWLERRGHVAVSVESAAPLSETALGDLRSAIARRTGRQAEIESRVDPDLLGGMVVRIGDQLFDSSLRAELARLERRLLDRASRELLSGRANARG